MNGKSKCKTLKDIRKQIALNNDIDFITSECKFQGDCLGTCPKCEAEVRYLEAELLKRKQQGKNIAVAGLAAALVVTAVGCAKDTVGSESSIAPVQARDNSTLATTDSSDFCEETEGEIFELQGDVIAPESIIDPTDSSYIEDEIRGMPPVTSFEPELEYSAQPNKEYFLTLSNTLQTRYLSNYSREEVQSEWAEYYVETISAGEEINQEIDVYALDTSNNKQCRVYYVDSELSIVMWVNDTQR